VVLGKIRIKIQEALEDFTKGGILFQSSKIFYIEENTLAGGENMQNNTTNTLKRLGAPHGALDSPKMLH
jgi:hypothetical protein